MNWAHDVPTIVVLAFLLLRSRRLQQRLEACEVVLSTMMRDPSLTCDHGVLHAFHCATCADAGDLSMQRNDE